MIFEMIFSFFIFISNSCSTNLIQERITRNPNTLTGENMKIASRLASLGTWPASWAPNFKTPFLQVSSAQENVLLRHLGASILPQFFLRKSAVNPMVFFHCTRVRVHARTLKSVKAAKPQSRHGTLKPQSRKAAKPQSRHGTLKPQSCKAAKPPWNAQNAKPQSRKAARPQSRKAAKPQSCHGTLKPQSRKAAKPPSRKLCDSCAASCVHRRCVATAMDR